MSNLIIPRIYEHRLKVYRRKDRPGVWNCDYYLPPQHGENEVRRRYKILARNQEQAELWKAHKLIALDCYEFDEADYKLMGVERKDFTNDPTLGEFLLEFRRFRELGRSKPLSPRTIDEQERTIERYFMKPIGNMKTALLDHRLSEFKRSFIQDFITELQEVVSEVTRADPAGHLSAKYINNITGVLGRILSIAEDRDKIERRPKIDKVPDQRQESAPDILRLDEVQRLWDVCQGSYGRMIRLLLLTGLRAMEIAGLRWEDYDEGALGGPILRVVRQYVRYGRKNNEPQFRAPKCNSQRIIPVGESLQAVLSEQKAETRLQDTLIFMTEAGRPVCNELLRKALHRACRRAGIRKVSPHALRRTFVSQTQMASGDLEAAGKLAGQREIRVTRDHYFQSEETHLRHVMGQLENRLLGTRDTPPGNVVELK
jgi:integrase